MTLPYFPLYPTDFDADTGHLSLAEDGAFNRLLRLSWRCPDAKMPNDLDWIFRKARAVTDEEKAVVASVISEFFVRKGGKIFNARLHKEWLEANASHAKRVEAGKSGGRAKALKIKKTELSNASELPEHCPSNQNQNQNHKEEEGGGGSAYAREAPISTAENPTFREKILTAVGADPISGLTGPSGKRLGTQADMLEAVRWLDFGLTEGEVLAEVTSVMAGKRDGPPSKFGYFTGAMTRLAQAKTAPPIDITPKPTAGGRSHERQAFDRSIAALADGLSAGTIKLDDSDRNPFAAR